MKTHRRRLVVLGSSALFVSLVGCATVPRPVPVPSEAVTPELGTVGVVVIPRDLDLSIPWRSGAGAAALKGGTEGLLSGPLGVAASGNPLVIVLSVFMTPYGIIKGAVCAAPSREIEGAGNTLKRELTSVQFNDALRDAVVRIAGERASVPIVPLMDTTRFTSNEGTTYRSLSTEGVHTIVEITVLRVALEPSRYPVRWPGAFIPGCGIDTRDVRVTASVRLVRVADDVELYHGDITYEKEQALAHTGSPDLDAYTLQHELQNELKRVPENLARKIVEKLFCKGECP